MRKRHLIIPLIILLCLSMNITAFAHPGRLDSNGGHNKTSDGTYHYHSGSDRTTEYKTPPGNAPSTPTPQPTPQPQPTQQQTPKEILVMVDSVKIQFDQPPMNLNGRVMVPIRYVVEEMGCSVEWDGSTQTVYINTSNIPLSKVAVKTEGINVYVNNEKIVFPDQQPVNMGGRILIPVRYVTEKLSYDVNWDGAVQTVYITRNTAAANIESSALKTYVDSANSISFEHPQNWEVATDGTNTDIYMKDENNYRFGHVRILSETIGNMNVTENDIKNQDNMEDYFGAMLKTFDSAGMTPTVTKPVGGQEFDGTYFSTMKISFVLSGSNRSGYLAVTAHNGKVLSLMLDSTPGDFEKASAEFEKLLKSV